MQVCVCFITPAMPYHQRILAAMHPKPRCDSFLAVRDIIMGISLLRAYIYPYDYMISIQFPVFPSALDRKPSSCFVQLCIFLSVSQLFDYDGSESENPLSFFLPCSKVCNRLGRKLAKSCGQHIALASIFDQYNNFHVLMTNEFCAFVPFINIKSPGSMSFVTRELKTHLTFR